METPTSALDMIIASGQVFRGLGLQKARKLYYSFSICVSIEFDPT